MSERIGGREIEGMQQRLASLLEMMFGPLKESQVAIRILQPRVQPNRFSILGSGFCILAEAGEDDPTKIMHARI